MFDFNVQENETNNTSQVDIFAAASLGDLKILQQAVNRRDFSPNLTNNSGWNAVMFTANYGHFNALRLLIDHGCDVNLQEYEHGRTALMLAASAGHTKCLETLIHHGNCDLHIADYDGKTAVHYATHYGHGNNKLICRLLKIKDSNCPRPITKQTHPPKIKITPIGTRPGIEKQRQLKDEDKSSYTSPFSFPTWFSKDSQSSRTCTPTQTTTPNLDVFSDSGQTRKRKLHPTTRRIADGRTFSNSSGSDVATRPRKSSSSSSSGGNLAKLNEKLAELERKVQFIEARISKGDNLN